MSNGTPARLPTVLVTGANRGIGLETARQLHQRGFHVVLAARDAGSGQAAADQLGATDGPGRVSFLPLDVSDSASVHAAATRFGQLADRLDALINNAGIYPDEGTDVLRIPRDQLARTFQTNTFGPVEVTQGFLPYLRRAAPGARVVNVSSGYGQLDGLSPQVPSYCLSKLTLNGVTIMLAAALRSEGIAVNSVCPGWVRSDMGGPGASRSLEQGADTIVWLAAEPPEKTTGRFFRDRREISW